MSKIKDFAIDLQELLEHMEEVTGVRPMHVIISGVDGIAKIYTDATGRVKDYKLERMSDYEEERLNSKADA